MKTYESELNSSESKSNGKGHSSIAAIGPALMSHEQDDQNEDHCADHFSEETLIRTQNWVDLCDPKLMSFCPNKVFLLNQLLKYNALVHTLHNLILCDNPTHVKNSGPSNSSNALSNDVEESGNQLNPTNAKAGNGHSRVNVSPAHWTKHL
jgi:hypothetical protein